MTSLSLGQMAYCMSLIFCFFFNSFELSASEKGEERVNITICSDDAPSTQVRFLQAVTPYLKISQIEFDMNCPADITGSLFMSFANDGNFVHLTLNGSFDGERIQNHRRVLPWLSESRQPLYHTLSAGKQIAFALLLETLLLDLEQIRLRFENYEILSPNAIMTKHINATLLSEAMQQPDPVPEFMPIPDPVPESVPDPVPAPAPEPVPESESVPVPDPVPVPAPKSAPATDQPRATKTEVTEKSALSAVSDHPPYQVSLGAGGFFLSPDVWGPSVSLYVARHLIRLGIFLTTDFQPTSTFHLGNRLFRTMLFSGRLGALVTLLETQRMDVELGIGAITRVSRFKRDQYESAKWQIWADVGASAHFAISVALWEGIGFWAIVGIDIFPKARYVGIENGPKKRLGLVGVPMTLGSYIKF